MRSMLSRSQAALLGIRENILLAQQIVAGTTFESFEESRVLFYAATRCLEILSEAARRLPDDMRARYLLCLGAPSWMRGTIMDAGNFYRHAYRNVEEKFVWRTIHGSLGPLLTMVVHEIDALPEDP
jgi:uncharacterized protein with HEPN domain